MGDKDGLEVYRNQLQHFRISGSVYFVTWRLHGSQGDLNPPERTVVSDSINHFKDKRYRLFAYVVMNDHVHVVIQPLGEFRLSSVLHSWKSYTANQFQRRFNRTGSIWQKDTYEQIVRGEDDLRQLISYVMNNPRKRWPNMDSYKWVEWFAEAWR